MISDYPLGTGGSGFKRVHASNYLAAFGLDIQAFSVHNGHINEACEWGVQGYLFRMAFFGSAMLLLWPSTRSASQRGDDFPAVLGCCLTSGVIGFLTCSLFGDFLDAEWGYWMVAFAVAHVRHYHFAVESYSDQQYESLPVRRFARPMARTLT